MEKLLDKLSSYNILNNLIPGSIFCYLLQYVCEIDIHSDSVIENLFLYYFVGMIISRLGSIVLEPIVIKLGIVRYAKYKDYITASSIDKKIDVLLEITNLYRTTAAGVLLVILVKLHTLKAKQIYLISVATPYLAAIMLFALFLLSYRKQAKYFKSRVDKVFQEGDGAKKG
ncbi:MAG: hypothetical protein ACOX7R_05990 [Acetivibrionales bacterium]